MHFSLFSKHVKIGKDAKYLLYEIPMKRKLKSAKFTVHEINKSAVF